jgi:hypothetical protein
MSLRYGAKRLTPFRYTAGKMLALPEIGEMTNVIPLQGARGCRAGAGGL